MINEVNEIDMMYINYALEHKGEKVDQETADAVNESIDKFCMMINETVDWLESDPDVKFICDHAKNLEDL